ncbi:MAG: hypothetical protein IJS47_06345 [Clostridia bacterium]|nr:hypothetical protein [Clostridia bacterium]
MLNSEYKISGKSTFDIMYLGLSIIKLERLGILQTEFLLTLGTSSPNNIDRIHITLLGQKILECFLNCDANIRGEENG